MSHKLIPATALKNDDVVLDVRTDMEHATERLTRAHDHVPLDRLDPQDFMMRRGLDKSADIYILCRSGNRAKQAADKFNAAGYNNVHVIDGGIMACNDCGIPTTGQAQAGPAPGAKKILPLERQVRIAAGSFVALGVLLGAFVAPAFYALSFFVGMGLIYAGVTDRCGLALVLTKAPWNKMSVGGSCSALKNGDTAGGCH